VRARARYVARIAGPFAKRVSELANKRTIERETDARRKWSREMQGQEGHQRYDINTVVYAGARALAYRNQDRFGFYEHVERCTGTGQRRDLYICGAISVSNAHVSGHYARSIVARLIVTRPFYRVALLYFVATLFYSLSLCLFLSSFLSLADDFEFIALEALDFLHRS